MTTNGLIIVVTESEIRDVATDLPWPEVEPYELYAHTQFNGYEYSSNGILFCWQILDNYLICVVLL